MDQPLCAPRNRTAELQLILRLVSQGYTLWTADQIPISKLPGFLVKWARYRLLADPAARAYRKQTGRANTHLVIEHRFNDLDAYEGPPKSICWLMLGTVGGDGLGDAAAHPGPIFDATNQGQRIEWMGYQLTRQPKHYKTGDGQLRKEITWTWRLPGRRYAEWEALLVAAAKQHDYQAINQAFTVLRGWPMFAGIRLQVMRLHAETNRVLKKMGGSMLPRPDLPVMTLLPLWPDKKLPTRKQSA